MVPGRVVRTTVLSRAVAALGLVIAAAGCGTVCDDAADVCGFDETTLSDDCSGVNECAAVCIVDWDACNVNDTETPESKCIASCLAQAEEGT
jgi:hypothetical protein